MLLTALVLALPLAAASPAYALHKDETATVGQVTATLSYDYKKTKYGLYDFSNLKVTIDRAGQRLVDTVIGTDCSKECPPWAAEAGAIGGKSVNVVDLDADGEPEVLVELYTGGANCCFYTESWRYDANQNAYVQKTLRPGLSFPYVLHDLNHDGAPEFESADYRFAYKYGSNAGTPRPLRIFDWDAGRLVDVTIAYPKRAAREAASLWKTYLQFRKKKDMNLRGVLAAYVADEYNARNGKVGWRNVVAAYRRGDVDKKFAGDFGPYGSRYLKSLRSFLKKLGYLRT
jgi:hypothetical protein